MKTWLVFHKDGRLYFSTQDMHRSGRSVASEVDYWVGLGYIVLELTDAHKYSEAIG